MIKDMTEKMKPITTMAEVNKSTAEQLISIQTEYMTDMFNAGVAQMKALSEVKEPKAAFELQIKYFKDLEARLNNVAEKDMATLAAAKEQFMDLIEKSVSEMTEVYGLDNVTKFMQTSQEKLEEVTKSFSPEMIGKKPPSTAKTASQKSAH
ncbi:phasin family protein [Neptunomonas antarctica]|nr:phasin family protein [Neptunomonas antarctica]